MNRILRALLAPLALLLAAMPAAWARHGADDVVAATIDATVTATVEDTVTTTVEDTVTATVEDTVTATVEDTVTTAVEDTVTTTVEDNVTSTVEDNVTTTVEGSVTATVEDSVTASVEDSVQGSVEQEAQDSVETTVETSVESVAESSAESSIDDSVEDAAVEVEPEVEDSIEDEVDIETETDSVSDSGDAAGLDDHGGDRVDNSGPGNADDNSGPGNADDDGGSDLSGGHSGGDSGPSENSGSDSGGSDHSGSDNSGSGNSNDAVQTAAAVSSGNSAATVVTSAASGSALPPEQFAGVGRDRDGNEISIGEWLVIATAEEIVKLEQLGYVTRSRESLEGLGRVLARMQAPDSFDIAATQAAIRRAVPDAEVDFNHVYRTGAGPAPAAVQGERPRELFVATVLDQAPPAAIGIIDTRVESGHPALRAARIHAQDFVSYAAQRPSGHGTSVASILVGDDGDYRGLLPSAELYAASVFFTAPAGGDTATTVSLVRALDWMTRNRVTVVNMSLAGPANSILEAAIQRAATIGTVIVAAVGNRGPAAKPLYPAAYPEVIAVTAVTEARSIYRLANRGAHVDFAAPGVNVLHAEPHGGYGVSSGTSMAAPFVTAVIAASCGGSPAFAACLRELQSGAEDIGVAGFDNVYGFGFIVPLPRIDRTASTARL